MSSQPQDTHHVSARSSFPAEHNTENAAGTNPGSAKVYNGVGEGQGVLVEDAHKLKSGLGGMAAGAVNGPTISGQYINAAPASTTHTLTPAPSALLRNTYNSLDSMASSGKASSGGLGSSSTTSRTHIPSLTPRAFFQPMSSQTLQVQRGQRPISPPEAQRQDHSDYEDGESLTNTRATSRGSVLADRDEDRPPLPTSAALPSPHLATVHHMDGSSEGRGMTHGDAQMDGTPIAHHTSRDNLQHNAGRRPMIRQTTSQRSYPQGAKAERRGRSPRSMVSSFRQASMRGADWSNTHEKLASRETLPKPRIGDGLPKNPKEDAGRNYEYFSGNTIFFWGGRLQNTRSRPISLFTALLVIVPAILFFIFSAPWLWHHVSPAIPIVFAYLLFICFSSFLHASLSNPGIFPRNLHPNPPVDPTSDPLEIGPPTSEWVMVLSPVAKLGAFEVPTKYCKSCNIWRPPRCHHCRVCDNCIDTQDHHCMWLNNCVGRRNYRYFFAFVASGTLLGIYLLGASIGHIISYRNYYNISTGKAITQCSHGVPFAMFIIGVLAFVYPAALWLYHIYLTARGSSTREFLNERRFLKKDRHRPFDQGSWLKNIIAVLMRARTPAYLNFRAKYEEGDPRFGPRRGKRTAPLVPQVQGNGVEMKALSERAPNFQGPTSRIFRGTVDRTPRREFDEVNGT